MVARRAEKLVLGVFFVWTLILSVAYSAAYQAPSEGTEAVPTPGTAEKAESVVQTAEGANTVTEQCVANGCTFEGVPLCSPPGRYWVRGDWMMWWTSGEHLPPLTTTSPLGTPQDQAGVLGQPGTSVLFGDSTVNTDGRPGVRITFGAWLDSCHRWGLEADWLTLGGDSNYFYRVSDGNLILALPYFDLQRNTQWHQLQAYPDIITGSVDVIGNDYFESVGMTLRYNLCCSSCGCGDGCAEPCDGGCGAECCDPCCISYCRTDLLMGYRHYLLGDNLAMGQDTYYVPIDSRFQSTDTFNTRNEFNGMEIGLNTELRRGRWSLGLLAKMALGENHQTATLLGSTTINNGQETITYPEGIYVTGSNSGVHVNNQFTVIPQFGAEIGYQITPHVRTFMGYNLIYWACVMRAGDQIDLNMDTSNWAPVKADGLPYPQYLGRQTNFWAQGINIGTEVRF
ncbi:MAG: BBP7 family outer membrane beta-barrel protein [Thermoguttaceae bacterium]